MATYNGHKNWNHWNVSLWINNDEGLYRTAKDCIRHEPTRDAAARRFLELLPDKTPDGAPYSVSAIKAAMVGM
jgi:hypothetical protein